MTDSGFVNPPPGLKFEPAEDGCLELIFVGGFHARIQMEDGPELIEAEWPLGIHIGPAENLPNVARWMVHQAGHLARGLPIGEECNEPVKVVLELSKYEAQWLGEVLSDFQIRMRELRTVAPSTFSHNHAVGEIGVAETIVGYIRTALLP